MVAGGSDRCEHGTFPAADLLGASVAIPFLVPACGAKAETASCARPLQLAPLWSALPGLLDGRCTGGPRLVSTIRIEACLHHRPQTRHARSHSHARTHAQAGMTQLGVSHRTAAAAIFYFLREQFNIHDLDFKMWCDEIGLPSSFTARKQDKQHRRVTQLSATQVDSLLRLATCVRCRRRRLCALLQTIPCAPAASARPLHRIASHRIAW